jgi:hypothetical protein
MGLRRDKSWASTLGIVALIVLPVIVSVVRPLARASGHLDLPPRTIRMGLLSVPAVDADTVEFSPAATDATETPVVVPALLSVLLLVLKTRRVPLHSAPLRRLKIPPRRAALSPSSH